MSGIIGHTMYAILSAKAATERRLPVAPLVSRHFASFLAGAYLGADIQTLPEAVCLDTSQEVGYGTVPVERSPITGGPVTPWKLRFQGQSYTPQDIHRLFYGRSHLVFGWDKADRAHTLPWDDLPGYLAAVVEDTIELFGPGERQLAYVFGWSTHVVGDSLIKSIRPGVTLDLLDGKYTPRNRPIQDLVTFHEIGRKELGLRWPDLLADLAETPVEPVQVHYMRVTRPRERLASEFPTAWLAEQEPLLRKVLAENRRYLKLLNQRLLQELELTHGPAGWECNEEFSRQAGVRYAEMVELADKAGLRHALWQIAEAIADLWESTVKRQPLLRQVPAGDSPAWDELTRRWARK